MSEIVTDQIGEEVIAVNIEIDQGLKHQNERKSTEDNTCLLLQLLINRIKCEEV